MKKFFECLWKGHSWVYYPTAFGGYTACTRCGKFRQ